MKPFNLEEFKNGAVAITRDGREATYVGVCEYCRANHQLIAHIEGDDTVSDYSVNGRFDIENNDLDLVGLKEPTIWFNVYRSSVSTIYASSEHSTFEAAKEAGRKYDTPHSTDWLGAIEVNPDNLRKE